MHSVVFYVYIQSKLNDTNLGFIWVGSFRINAFVVYDILEGSPHVASIAPMVSILTGAVNKVLCTERHQFPCLEF